MPSDEAVMKAVDMACSHLIFARFGRWSPRATRALYRTAAGLFEEVAQMLWDISHAEEELARAERMIGRERWR